MRDPKAWLLQAEAWGHLQAHALPAASAQHAAAASPSSPCPGHLAGAVTHVHLILCCCRPKVGGTLPSRQHLEQSDQSELRIAAGQGVGP